MQSLMFDVYLVLLYMEADVARLRFLSAHVYCTSTYCRVRSLSFLKCTTEKERSITVTGILNGYCSRRTTQTRRPFKPQNGTLAWFLSLCVRSFAKMATDDDSRTDHAVIGSYVGAKAAAAAAGRSVRAETDANNRRRLDGHGVAIVHDENATEKEKGDDDVSPEADSSDESTRRTWDDVGMYQGYTPLTDDSMWNGQGAMLTTIGHQQDGDSDDNNNGIVGGSGGGVFFADMSAFFQAGSIGAGADVDDGASGSCDDDNNSQQHDETSCQGNPQYEPVGGGELDFRSVADRALTALDREYQQVVSFQSRLIPAAGVNGDDNVPASAAAVATAQVDEPELVSHQPYSERNSNCDETVGRESDTDVAFVADFAELHFDAGGNEGDDGRETDEQKRQTLLKSSSIDVEKVQRAVQAIRFKRPGFISQVDEWAKAQQNGDESPTQGLQLLMATAPMDHAIIPSVSLKAFRRRTAKALAATSALTRSATIAEALHRLDLLQSQNHFVIHVVGCDSVECQSEDRMRAHFGPIARWIGSYAEAPRNLTIVLIGPSIPASAPALLKLAPAAPAAHLTRRLESAEIRCLRGGLYHECLADGEKSDGSPAVPPPSWITPDLVVAFHAGIWGYSTWEATFEHQTSKAGRVVPWVITAYTIQEAEDDADALEGILLRQPPPPPTEFARARFSCVWPPEWNPYASQQPRETVTAPNGRTYRENAAWSCWKI
jgi:hypothetical protein